ncbi:MAG: alpha/beta hydrolase [Candidatus Krumholzibacteria bacterium]|nr:alpha/beta hydrolase [Candidatus Krumholzibacteria bacterium]
MMKRVSIVMLAALLAVVLGPLCAASARNGTVKSQDGIPLSYTVQGKDTPAIVFVHCWSCDKSYWKDQLPYFEKKYTVVALDLAGHGDSGLGRADWTVESFAADVVAVVDALKLKKVILVGHSMGGPVSLEAARMMPGRVIGVIGVDTFQDFGETYSEEQQKQWLDAFQADFSKVTDGFVRSMFAAGADTAIVDRIAADMASGPPEVGIGAMKNMLRYDPAPAVREIKVPIRGINADKWPTNVEGNKKLAASFSVKLMPGRGHFVQIEDPATFNKLLDETIAEIVKGK